MTWWWWCRPLLLLLLLAAPPLGGAQPSSTVPAGAPVGGTGTEGASYPHGGGAGDDPQLARVYRDVEPRLHTRQTAPSPEQEGHPRCFPAESTTAENGGDGTGCAACPGGYYRLVNQCFRCDAARGNLFKWLLPTFVLFYCVVLRTLAGRHYLECLRLVFYFCEGVSLCGALLLDWPPATLQLLNNLSALGLNIEIFAPECAMTVNYTVLWVVQMLVPVMVGLGLLLTFAVEWFFKYVILGHSMARTKVTYFACLFMTLLFLHFPLARRALVVFPCFEDSTSGQMLMVADSSIACQSGQHNALIGMGAVCTLVYIVLVPAVVGYLLFRNRFGLDAFDFEQKFYILYWRYHPPYFWWEGVKLSLHLLAVILVTAVHGYPLTQSVLLFGLWAVDMALTFFVKPYYVRVFNWMDVGLGACTLAILLFGMLHYSQETQSVVLVAFVYVSFIVGVLIVGGYIMRTLKQGLWRREAGGGSSAGVTAGSPMGGAYAASPHAAIEYDSVAPAYHPQDVEMHSLSARAQIGGEDGDSDVEYYVRGGDAQGYASVPPTVPAWQRHSSHRHNTASGSTTATGGTGTGMVQPLIHPKVAHLILQAKSDLPRAALRTTGLGPPPGFEPQDNSFPPLWIDKAARRRRATPVQEGPVATISPPPGPGRRPTTRHAWSDSPHPPHTHTHNTLPRDPHRAAGAGSAHNPPAALAVTDRSSTTTDHGSLEDDIISLVNIPASYVNPDAPPHMRVGSSESTGGGVGPPLAAAAPIAVPEILVVMDHTPTTTTATTAAAAGAAGAAAHRRRTDSDESSSIASSLQLHDADNEEEEEEEEEE